MYVNRSPPHSNITSHTGSQPNLSSLAAIDSSTLQKRKRPDFDIDIGNELADFRSEIMSFLYEFKTSNNELITNLRSDVTDLNNKVTSITTSLNNLSIEQSRIKTDLSQVTESVEFLSNMHDDLKSKVSTLSADVIEQKKTRSDLAECQLQLTTLQTAYNIQQQRERINNIEISGIPMKNNEDVSYYLMQICLKLGVQISTDDIIHIHRVPTRVPNKPKNIVAKMKTQLIKDSIISAIRKNKGITSTDIGLPGDCQRIFINEHLIPYFKKLHKQTREAATQSGYAYVWVRNGKIFIRKNDTSPPIVISDYADLNKVK